MEIVDAPPRVDQVEEGVVEQCLKMLQMLPVGKAIRFEKKRNWSTATIVVKCIALIRGWKFDSYSVKNGDDTDGYIKRIG